MEQIVAGDWSSVASETVRLLAAMLLAGAIGYEREGKDHAAGLRTHMLVGIGSCLFTLLMRSLVEQYSTEETQADPIRIVEAVTSGVAFLAAGAIIQARGQVRGLTTGASLWLVGAVGLACGLGQFLLAAIAVIITLVVLRVMKLLV